MDNTERFSDRVNDYIKYRPSYPEEIIDYLQRKIRLEASWQIADIGSGTGISSALFLSKQHKVFGVEPNDEMRHAAEKLLAYSDKFISVNGSAEDTKLPNQSIDLIIAAQAFHWFEANAFKQECKRIGKENSYVMLMWNERLLNTEFLIAYEALINKFASDYKQIDHRNFSEAWLETFYHPQKMEYVCFDNFQSFDYDGLKGRLLSSSYIPAEPGTSYDNMLSELRMLFDRFQENNQIRMNYKTTIYLGTLK